MRKKQKIGFVLLLLIIMLISVEVSARDFIMSELYYSNQKELKIDAGGVNIIFEENSNKIFISEGLLSKITDDKIHIRSPQNYGFFDFISDEEYKIIIGTDIFFEDVDINVGGAKITGLIKSNNINIDGGGANIAAEMKANKLYINGGGVNIDSSVEAEYISVSGAAMKMELSVKGAENLKIDGAAMKAQIKYLDFWENERELSVNGVAGMLKVLLPNNNSYDQNNKLDIETDGIIKVEVEYYDL